MATAPVVVGVDGSAAALLAVDHAVDEAQLRHRPLRVVHADPFTDGLAVEPRQVVQDAVDRVAARSPVPVTSAIIPSHPAPVLLEESRTAALLVLGYRGHGGLPGTVVSEAACPVLVVRGTAPAAGPVLVGVSGTGASDAALDFAFEAAALRGAALTALHAWTGPVWRGPGDMLPLVYDPAVVAEEAGRTLNEALVGWQAKYPDVAVTELLVPGHPGSALVAQTSGAGLVVVGAHGHRAVPGWLVGSVPHLLLHQAHCPVAVVPDA